MTKRLLLLAAFILASLPGLAAARDPLAPLDIAQPPVEAVPADLFLPDQLKDITNYTNEARQFGVPLAVRVISMPAIPGTLNLALPFRGVLPSNQQIVQRMADTWLVEEGVESSPGADDGILLFVVVSENDHTQSLAAFATGTHAIPLNGLTNQSLDTVLNTIILPSFQQGSIGDGITSGVSMLSYDNLFARPARLIRTSQQDALFTVANTALVGITSLASLGLAGLTWWIRGRKVEVGGDIAIGSPFEAGALRRGRVDDAVVTGALLHLVYTGALTGNGTQWRLGHATSTPDAFQQRILACLSQETDPEGIISDAAIRRIQDVLTPARVEMENQLASRKLLNPAAQIENIWLTLASAGVAFVALFALVPSIVSMSRIGIAGIVIAALTITGVLVWATTRSWTTDAGRRAVTRWEAKPHSDDTWRMFDTVVNQHALLDPPGGPGVPPMTRLTRQFRALGAG